MSRALEQYLSQWNDILVDDDGNLVLEEGQHSHDIITQDWLDRTIHLAEQVIAEMGDIGVQFNAAAKALNVPEKVTFERSEWGASISAFEFGVGYNAELVYGPAALCNPYEFISSRFHEYIHGFQMQNAPVLHASPANPVERLVMLPSDYIKLRELMEFDAYAKQGWLTEKFIEAHGLEEQATVDWAVDLYRGIRRQDETLSDRSIMMSMVVNLMRNTHIPGSNDPFMSLYHDQSLGDYEMATVRWKDRHPERQEPDLIRITGADMQSVGDSFGPNIFAHPDNGAMLAVFAQPTELRAPDIERVATLHHSYGLDEPGALDECDSFAQALTHLDMTAADFVSDSIAGYVGMAQTPPKNPPVPKP